MGNGSHWPFGIDQHRLVGWLVGVQGGELKFPELFGTTRSLKKVGK